MHAAAELTGRGTWGIIHLPSKLVGIYPRKKELKAAYAQGSGFAVVESPMLSPQHKIEEQMQGERNIIMFDDLKETIKAYKARDPAARSSIEIFLLYPGLKAVRSYRKANWCYRHGYMFMARLISQSSRRRTGIEIHPGATIGRRLVIDHGMGIVIGETAEIGDDCLIYHGVTLGGTGKDIGKRHPTIGNNVLIGTGAKVLGPIKVGSNSRIAANSVVLNEIPEDSTAVGIPAKIVKIAGKKANYVGEVDQVNVSDPVSTELAALRRSIEELVRSQEK